METIAFFVLTVLAILSALVVITHRHPVMCALALAFNLVSIAGFYLLLDAQFIAFLQVIVYAGAIMVLILFVVMLLNLREEARAHPPGSIQAWFGPALALLLVAILSRAILTRPAGRFSVVADDYGTAASVGRELFGRFFYPFELLSLLLVAAMIGAVLLAKKRL
jgi:NADH-quinone oxidoreductase subunit J